MESKHIDGLLSVVVVTYNQPKYLFETIQSILSQDYPSIELIIADDGTKDFHDKEIVDYIEQNKNQNLQYYVLLHDGINRGTVRNINHALGVVHGEYVKLIGGDDAYSSCTTFGKEIDLLKKDKEALGVISKVQQCDAFLNKIHSDRVERSNDAIEKVLKMDYDSSRSYIAKNDIFPIAIQATCFRWRFFETEGFCDERFVVIDDSPTVLKILRNHNRFLFLDDITVNHRTDVGISISKELFAARRIKYYKDCVTYSENEIKPNPQIYGYAYSYMAPKVDMYVYQMAKLKAEGKRSIKAVLLTCKYILPLSYYFCKNTSKVVYRIRRAKDREVSQ